MSFTVEKTVNSFLGASHVGINIAAKDHDHTTGEIRGLLCTRCNVTIGNLRDDYALAEAIAAYLRFFKDK